MELPWGTLAILGTLWTVGLLAYSLAVAFVVARFASRPVWVALLLGLLLPVVGPWAWASWEFVQAARAGYRAPPGAWRPQLATASYLWWASAGLVIAALVFPWVVVSATVDGKYDDSFQASPIDTVLGGVVLGAFAAALVLSGLYAGRFAARRQAVLLGGVATVLMLVAVSSAIIYSKVANASDSIATWTDQRVEGQLAAGPALWITAVASVLVLVGCVIEVAQAGPRDDLEPTAVVGTPPVDEEGSSPDPWGAPTGSGASPDTGIPSWDRSRTGGW